MDKKIIILISVFIIYFSFIGFFNYSNFGVVNGGQDFYFHYSVINGDSSLNEDYPDFYHSLFSPFGFNQLAFYLANVVLIVLFIPFLVFKVTRTYWGVLIYFLGVSLPHVWFFGATYPQALVFAFLLLYLLCRKNIVVFFGLMFLASLTHSLGFYLFLLFGIMEVLHYVVVHFVFKKWEKNILDRLKPFFLIFPAKLNNSVMLFFFLFIHNSFIVLFYAIKSAKLFYLLIALISIYLAQTDFRIASVAQLCFLITASPEIAKTTKRKKLIILALLMIQLTYFVLDFGLGSIKIASLGGSL